MSVLHVAVLMKAEPEVFLDTNVLLYAVSNAPEEAMEYAVAWRIIEENNWGISVQVLQEFYVNVIGKLRERVRPQVTGPFLESLLTRPIVTTTPDLFNESSRHKPSLSDQLLGRGYSRRRGTAGLRDTVYPGPEPRPDVRRRDCRRPVLAGRPPSAWHL